MDYSLEDVKNFILKFTESEYQLGLAYYDKSVNTEKWEVIVHKLDECYGIRYGYYAIINTTRNVSLMTKDNLENEKKNLKKRKLFVIRKYENPVFGKGIVDTDTNVLFSCFLGANMDMGAEVYPDNLSVGIVKGQLKIITERHLNSEKRRNQEIIEWILDKKSNLYLDDITIKKEGELVDTLRVFEPEHPTWLTDYNS